MENIEFISVIVILSLVISLSDAVFLKDSFRFYVDFDTEEKGTEIPDTVTDDLFNFPMSTDSTNFEDKRILGLQPLHEKCAEGFRRDYRGRCRKIIRIRDTNS